MAKSVNFSMKFSDFKIQLNEDKDKVLRRYQRPAFSFECSLIFLVEIFLRNFTKQLSQAFSIPSQKQVVTSQVGILILIMWVTWTDK